MADGDFNPTEAQAPEVAQGHNVVSTPDVQPVTGQGGEGPWSASLQTTFTDEATRAQVDAYLRENVQPYVTKLEQGRPPEEAASLYSDYQEDPIETHLAVTEQLYGPEARAAVESALFGEDGEQAQEEALEAVEEGQRDPEVQALLDREAERERETAYYDTMLELAENDPNFDEDEFSPFVIGTEGNVQEAYAAYTNWRGKVQARYTPAQTDVAGAEAPDPVPPVLGSTAPGGSAPPTQRQHGSLEEEMDNWFAEQQAAVSR